MVKFNGNDILHKVKISGGDLLIVLLKISY